MRNITLRGGRSVSHVRSSGKRSGGVRLQFECLESRQLMSATAFPEIEALSASSSYQVYTPSQIRHAYGFDQVTFKNGSVQGNGSGQTIAIIDAYGDANIAGDLAKFDATFRLSNPASFKVVNQTGGTNLPGTNSSWAMETSLDVEWAHAIAPGANILLVEAKSSSLGDLLTAVDYARHATGVSVVSMSWGGSEFNGETSYDSYFTTPAGHIGVTFVGSSGDNGAPSLWPALSPNVLSVGGTTLNLSANGSYSSETAWNGSGGGYSLYEAEPSFQRSVQSSGKRSGPDVSYDANPNTGFYVCDSVGLAKGQSGWWAVGGTSAGAPQWSALVAIANQGRALNGQGAFSGVQSQIYALPSNDFHDVTSGSNGYSAGVGYDEVTGRGSPIANFVIAGLVGGTTAATPAVHFTHTISLSHFNYLSLGDSDGSVADPAQSFIDLGGTQSAQQSNSTAQPLAVMFNAGVSGSTGQTGAGVSQSLVSGVLSPSTVSTNQTFAFVASARSAKDLPPVSTHSAEASAAPVAVRAHVLGCRSAMDATVDLGEYSALPAAVLNAVWSSEESWNAAANPLPSDGPAEKPIEADGCEISPVALACGALAMGWLTKETGTERSGRLASRARRAG